MSRAYRKIRRSVLYIVFTLVGAFAIATFLLVSQESDISANKDRNAEFHMQSILRAANASKQILRSREQLLAAIQDLEHEIQGEGHTPHLQPAQGYQALQVIRNDYDRILELQAAYRGDRYEATLEKLSVQYEQLSNLGKTAGLDAGASLLAMRDDLARLENLYLTFNQLERLHIGSYEKLDSLIESQVARRNLVGIPLSIIILLSALAIIAYLASQTEQALDLQEQSENELRTLNAELEHRIAERTQSLEQSRQTYRTLFEQAPIAYCNISRDGVIRRWNTAAEQMFGAPGQDLGGKNITEFYHPTSLGKARDLLAHVSAGQAVYNEEMLYVRHDGEQRFGLLSITPILDADGDVIESLLMDVDISKLREAQDKVATMQQELLVNERLATIGQLTATVSHELRNPLGAIRSATDVLRRLVSEGSKPIDRSFALLERSQIRCDRIIGELLNYTRVQGLNLRNTQIDTWLNELLENCDIPPEIDVHFNAGFKGEVFIDQERIEQAVRNVVDNACDAMSEDTEGEISADRHELTVTSRSRDQRFEVSIKDTGHGIEQELQAKIFDPLFTTKSFGVGLGLPMVRRIMEQHGGGVSISGAPGEGTEVVLWIPGDSTLPG